MVPCDSRCLALLRRLAPLGRVAIPCLLDIPELIEVHVALAEPPSDIRMGSWPYPLHPDPCQSPPTPIGAFQQDRLAGGARVFGRLCNGSTG
jgi:hypothetical protein